MATHQVSASQRILLFSLSIWHTRTPSPLSCLNIHKGLSILKSVNILQGRLGMLKEFNMTTDALVDS